jgi:hypothetical protein
MPVMKPKAGSPVYPVSSPVQIAKPQYQGTTVDTTLTPVTQLLTHIEGSSWIVNYYSQVIDRDSDVAGQGLATPGVQQQYRKIKELELKVSSPLSYSQDDESKASILTGTAVVYPPLRPNVGDMFIADIGAGREAVLEITSSEQLAIFKQTCFQINYKVTGYSENGRFQDLESKVVQTTVFVKEFMTYGQNPILFEEEYDHLVYIRRKYRSIVEQYLRSFTSNEFATILIPDQAKTVYDPYLVNAIKQVFTTDDHAAMYELRVLNVQDDEVYRAVSIWDALIKRDKDLLSGTFAQYGLVRTVQFSSDPMLEGIRWSGIDSVIYPVDPALSVDYRIVPPSKMVTDSKLDYPTVQMRMSDLIKRQEPLIRDQIKDSISGFVATNADGTASQAVRVIPPVVHPSMQDGYYVLSRFFYEDSQVEGKQSQLELMVRDFLEHRSLSLKAVRDLVENISEWNSINRFYYIPIVVILMRASLRGI